MKILRLLLLFSAFCWQCAAAEQSLAEFTKDKQLFQGYYAFYYDQQSGKVYLAIDKLEQPFLFQSSMPYGIGSNDIGLDRGQLGATRIVQFERIGDKVLLRQLNTDYRADSDNAEERDAVAQAFASSVLWGFKVVQHDEHRVLIDYTPFLLSDIHNIAERLQQKNQGSFAVDASRSAVFLQRTKAFPNNTELEATVTFKGSKAGDYLMSVTPDPHALSVHLHHSLIALPDDDYQPRAFHPDSGYWSIAHADYASAIDQPLLKRVLPRHRLQKLHPEAKSSVARQPIVYYLDAGVPEPVRSALLEGASWWNQAFTAIGYKDAFQVKVLPPDVDPMDVRYNVIQWVHRATRGWSYGSSVIDPRSGEIIKGHVTLGSLRVRQDYLIAAALTSPYVSNDADTSALKAMALARIRQLAAHEVGHTLGLAHNFAASVNQRASVMDYPHPYVQIKDGKLDLSDAYAKGIGAWDKYVIAYGYGEFPAGQETEALQALRDQARQQGLKYLSDPDARPASGGNAYAHLWDNGADAVAELQRVLAVRELALRHFGINSIAYQQPLSELAQTLVPLYNFHRYQVEAVAKLIAGLDYSYEVKQGEDYQGVHFVNGEQQQLALKALLATLDAKFLTLPDNIIKLIPPQAYGYSRDRESFPSHTGLAFDPVSAAQASAQFALKLLLNPQRLARLQQQAAIEPAIFSVPSVLTQLLASTVKHPSESGLAGVVQQRINQTVVDELLALLLNKALVAEVRAPLRLALKELATWLAQSSSSRAYKNPLFAHYQLLKQQIDFALEHGKTVEVPLDSQLPPGSPIGS